MKTGKTETRPEKQYQQCKQDKFRITLAYRAYTDTVSQLKWRQEMQIKSI